MPFTSAQLATEINTDPKALGLVALATARNRNGIAAKLNATYAGVGPVYRTDVPASELRACIVWSEVAAFTQVQVEWEEFILNTGTGTIDASNPNTRGQLAGLFASTPTTLGNLAATVLSKLSSRAEELWGYGTHITEQDVANALGQ